MKGHRTLEASFRAFVVTRVKDGHRNGHQRAFAEAIGITEDILSRLLSDKPRKPGLDTAQKLTGHPANVAVKEWGER